MRVLHAVKTVDGARWAVDQVRELVKFAGETCIPALQIKYNADNVKALAEMWLATGLSQYVGKET